MPERRERRYFIVKHGLDAFEALPGFIWRVGMPRTETPPRFSQVRLGDRWVEFAYIKDEEGGERRSLITGFYECTREGWYGDIPRDRATSDAIADWPKRGWMIEGKPFGEQPRFRPVNVPPINEMLGRTVFGRGAIIPLRSAKEFERIRKETRKRQLDPNRIPLLRREPRNEQEVLSVVVSGHEELGIEKVIKVQSQFPDMTVSIHGKEVHLELEFDSLGFWLHWDDLRRFPKCRGKRQAKLRDKNDDTPVAVLCWVDGDKLRQLRKEVRHLRVFELQTLLREGKKIEWR